MASRPPKGSEQFQQFLEDLKARLFYAETSGGKYDAKPPINPETGKPYSTATGKYQFIWGNPNSTKKGFNGWHKQIIQFAKDSGYADVAKAQGVKLDQEFFLNTPQLQEDFFDHYAYNNVYDKAMKLSKNNPRNLEIGEIAQLYHMSPEQATNYVKGGEFNPPGNNLGAKEYLAKGRQGLQEKGITPFSLSDAANPEQNQKAVSKYFDEIKKIQDSNKSQGAKDILIKEIQKEYKSQGLDDDINRFIEARSAEDRKTFESDRESFNQFYDFFTGNNDYMTVNGSGNKLITQKDGKPLIRFDVDTTKGKMILDNILEANPELKSAITKGKNGAYKAQFRVGNNTPFVNFLDKGLSKFYGTSLKDTDGKFDPKFLFNNANDDLFYDFNSDLAKSEGKNMAYNPVSHSNLRFHELLSPKDFSADASYLEIDATIPYKDKTYSDNVDSASKKSAEELLEESNQANNQAYSGLYNMSEMDVPNMGYDKKDFAQKIPFEAVASGLLAMKGMKMADTPIPMRDEQVSAMFMDYTNKLQRLTEIGLSAAEEAKAKDDLSAGYSKGLDNIVAASAGNRNLVLGNQGQLENARLRGIIDMNVADARAKRDAMRSYGNAAQYINEFDSRRDIANKTMEQNIAIEKRQAGSDLAAAGFTSLIDSIKSQKENGPGSPRHMMQSMVRQKILGYDPEKKDDGSPGTKSYYEKNVLGKIRDYNERVGELNTNLSFLNNDQRKFVENVFTRTNDPGILNKAAIFARNNNVSNANYDNLGLALENDNFGYMTNQESLTQESLAPTTPEVPEMATPGFAPPRAQSNNGLLSPEIEPTDPIAAMNLYYLNQ